MVALPMAGFGWAKNTCLQSRPPPYRSGVPYRSERRHSR